MPHKPRMVDRCCVICRKAYQARAVVVRKGRGCYCSRSCANVGFFKSRKQDLKFIARRAASLRKYKPSALALERAAAWHRSHPVPQEIKDKRVASLRATLADPERGPKVRAALSARRLGKKHKPETKAAIRAAHRTPEKRAAASSRMKAWIYNLTREQREAWIKSQRKRVRPNKIERRVAEILSTRGVVFLAEHPIPPYIVDFLLPDYKLVIECDGDYWHGLDRIKARDTKKDAYLKACGYRVLRLPEHAIKAGEAEALIERVVEAAQASLQELAR